MSWSLDLFAVRGIRMRVHASFVLILIWAAWYWSRETADPWQGAMFGVAATLLLFLCVTLHELGHSFQALSYGIPVKDITLYPIGGVARINEIPTEPMREFRIAIAGPLVNVGIFLILLVVGFVSDAETWRSPQALADEMVTGHWSGLLPYLAMANLWLALFNLIPAFPMDGGRILRSLLAVRMGLRRATTVAMSVGQAMAFLFGFWGFATGNIFLIVIAVFVWMGAGQEGQDVVVRDILGDTRVGQVMIRQPAILSPMDPLSRAVELTLSTAQSDFPVVESDGRVVGLLTMQELVRALHNSPGTRIGLAMRAQFPLVRIEETVVAVQQRLGTAGISALPVVDIDGRLVGMLTATDIGEAFRLRAALNASAEYGTEPMLVRQ